MKTTTTTLKVAIAIVLIIAVCVWMFNGQDHIRIGGGSYAISPDGRWLAEIEDGHSLNHHTAYAVIQLWDLHMYPSLRRGIHRTGNKAPTVRLEFPQEFQARDSHCTVSWATNSGAFFIAFDAGDPTKPRQSRRFRYELGTNTFSLSPASESFNVSPTVVSEIRTASLEGTWYWRDFHLQLELSAGGHWRCWEQPQSNERPSDPPANSGTWFLRDKSIYLCAEQASARFGPAPGLGWIFEVIDAKPREMLVRWAALGAQPIPWRRIDQSGNAAEMPPGQTAVSTNVANMDMVASVRGTWESTNDEMMVELSADGHWYWQEFATQHQSPLMKGKWFIQQQALYLRIEEHRDGGNHGLMPGAVLICQINKIETNALHLAIGQEAMTWKRAGNSLAAP